MIELEENKKEQHEETAEGLIHIRTEPRKEEPKAEKAAAEENINPKSDKILIVSILLILVLLGAFLSVRFLAKPKIATIDDLNQQNIEGKTNPDEGYLYKGVYSFVKSADLWFFQLKSPSGNNLYNIPLHFGPIELEDIKPNGKLSKQFENSTDIYITFDPLAPQLQYTALAVGELDQSLINAFGKHPIAACSKNETAACENRQIITCEDADKAPVIYFQNNETTAITYQDNCIIVQGDGIEQVRAVDRMLLQWYGVMD